MARLTYQEALQWIHGIGKSAGIRPGLERMHLLLEKMGSPHRRLRCVHIGGTNGKGSTASMLASILESTGLRVGLYTSPYLEQFTNRMSINGADISPRELARAAGRLRPLVQEISQNSKQGMVSEFEVVTALAFDFFARHRPHVVILEVGLGGRLDATNVITPLVSVITNVSMEHMDYLGNTIEDIAREKAGIIKSKVPLVTAARDPAVLSIIRQRCLELNAPLCRVAALGAGEGEKGDSGEEGEKEVYFGERRVEASGQRFNYRGLKHRCEGLFLPLRGEYQVENAATALAVLEHLESRGYRAGEEDIRGGLQRVKWPGRLEVVKSSPLTVLDGAHNPHAVENLSRAVREHFTYRKLILVLGILKDKDISSMLGSLLPLAHQVIVTLPPISRGTDPGIIASRIRELSALPVEVLPQTKEAVERAFQKASPGDLVLICGSLYTVAEARKVIAGVVR